MNREGIKKHKDVFDAWIDGATVQTFYDGGWNDVYGPGFYEDSDYRIKPVEPVVTVEYCRLYKGGIGALSYNTLQELFIDDRQCESAYTFPVKLTYRDGKLVDIERAEADQ